MVFGFFPVRHRYLIAISLVLLVTSFLVLIRMRSNPEGAILPLNLISGLALIYPLVMILGIQISSAQSKISIKQQASNPSLPASAIPMLDTKAIGYQPDIYYIILDSYTNANVLEQCFSYDNSKFLDQLRELGFYVANDSRTNFTITDLSLASSLNMNYPQQMGAKPEDAANFAILANWIRDSVVLKALKQSGYKTVGFDSGYTPTDWTDANYYFSPEKGLKKFIGSINPFESMLMETSAGIILYDSRQQLPGSIKMILDSAYMLHRERILNTFQALESVPDIQEPTFAFAHILAPHNPFVFGPNGEFVPRNVPFTLNDDQNITSGFRYKRQYTDQVTYLNTRTIEVIQAILKKSSKPPIIIIQGDHGASRWITSKSGRSDILNAYYIPFKTDSLYQKITPVNSFRVIFNSAYNTSLPLLKDQTFYTTHSTIDTLLPVGSSKKKCNPAYMR